MFFKLILENANGDRVDLTTTANQYMTSRVEGLNPPTGTISTSSYAGITLTRMTVPCCGGMEYAIKRAIEASGKDIPLEVAVISPDGSIVEIRK